MIGTVKWFDAQKGYGFIQPDDGGADVFCHIKDLTRTGIVELREGDRLTFEIGTRNGKQHATALRMAGAAPAVAFDREGAGWDQGTWDGTAQKGNDR